MRRTARLTAAAVVAALLVFAPTLPAVGFPRPALCETQARVPRIWYVFSDPAWDVRPSGWYGWSYRDVAVQGFNRWLGDLNRDGSPLLSIDPDSSTGARMVRIVWSTAPGGDAARDGFYNCSLERIEVNTALRDEDVPTFQGLTAHEMGHALGARHTGADDSLYPGDPAPTMATCWGFAVQSATNDDAASMTYHHGIGANPTLTANYGFETDFDWFWASGANPTVVSGSTSGGRYHISVVPHASIDNVHQSVNWTSGWDRVVRPSLQYATPGATAGVVRVQMWASGVRYAAASGDDGWCGFTVSGADQNHRDYEEAWRLVIDGTYPLSSTWRIAMPSSGYLVPYVSRGSTDLRVRVYSSANVSGGYVHVHYDDVRIQEG